MKKTVAVWTVCAVVSVIAGISGDFNTWCGWLAGEGATGDRATVIGAGAGGEAMMMSRSTFVGAGAGMRSDTVQDSVAVGANALRGAVAMSNVVAIGANVLKDASGVFNETHLNGHFMAGNGRFYVKADHETDDVDAPIYYADGTLYLNARSIVTSAGGSLAGEETLERCDYYVSESGNDTRDGLSPETAFKTLDRAYEKAPDGSTVGVLPGRYDYPNRYRVYNSTSNEYEWKYRFPTNALHFVGLKGKERTFVVSTNHTGLVLGIERNNQRTSWRGFSFDGVGTYKDHFTDAEKGALYLCAFENCRFEFYTRTQGTSGLSYDCNFYSCELSGTLYATSRVQTQGINPIFTYTTLVDTIASINTQIQNGSGAPNFGFCIAAENSFVKVGELCKGIIESSGYPEFTMTNTTLLVESISYDFGGAARRYNDCIIGIGDGTSTYNFGERNILTSYTNAVENINPRTHKPTLRAWRWYGYDSADDRELKDAILEAVRTEFSTPGQTE